MANKRTLKKALNEMVIDVVDECFTIQLLDATKVDVSNKLIDEAVDYLDETLSQISAAKHRLDFKPIISQFQEKSKYFVEQLNSLN
jgi:hypothetical protein